MATQMDLAVTIIFVLGYASGAFVVVAAVLAARKENWDLASVDEVVHCYRRRRITRLRRRVARTNAASSGESMSEAEKQRSKTTEILRDSTQEVPQDVENVESASYPEASWPDYLCYTPVELNDGRLYLSDTELMYMVNKEKTTPQRVLPRILTPYSGTFPINVTNVDGSLKARRVKFGWDIRIHHKVSTGIVFMVKCDIQHSEFPKVVIAAIPSDEIPTLLDGRKRHEQREILCRLYSQEINGQITIVPMDKPHPSELSWHPTGSVFEFQRRRSRMADMTIVPKMDPISFVYEFDVISSKKGRVHVRYDTEGKKNVHWLGGIGSVDVTLTILAEGEVDGWRMNYSVILSILFTSGDKERLSNMIIWTERAYNVIEEFGNLSPIEISD